MEREYEDGTEPTVLPHMSKRPYLPVGCDQQGRYPHVAESATELGVGDEQVSNFELVKAVLMDVLIAAGLVVGVALVVWSLVP